MAVSRRPPGIDQPRPEVVTRPVNTYARPEPAELPPDAPARTDLLRLAQSLSGTSEALADYARAYTRSTSQEGVSEAIGLRQRTPAQELARMLNTPGGVPANVNRTVLEIEHGENLARTHITGIRQRYLGQSTAPTGQPSNAFDRNAGDLDAWWAGVTRELEATVPQQHGVLYGWRRIMQGEQERLYGAQAQHIQQRTLQANLDAAHSAFYGIATQAIDEGIRDPRAIHQRMQEALPRTTQMHLLTPQQANAALFSAARAIAEQGVRGNPQLAVDLVRELLLGQRTGANGQVLPPLGTSNEYAHLTNQAIEAAQRRAGELQRELHTESIVRFREQALNGQLDEEAFNRFVTDNPQVLGPNTQATREAILLQNRTALDRARTTQQNTAEEIARRARADESEAQLNEFLRRLGDEGRLQSVPDGMPVLTRTGETRVIQREALQNRARSNEIARIREWGRQVAEWERSISITGEGPTPGPSIDQRVFDRIFEFLNRNGLENPEWRDILVGGHTVATPAAVAAQTPPPLLLEAVQLYETLEARAPGMLERHLPSQSARDFYRVYRIARTLSRQDERQALASAVTATSDIGADETRAPSFQRLERELANAQSIFPWAASITNFGDMRDDISRLARLLVRMGMNPEDALRTAGDDVRGQYTNINGFMVRTGDRVIESYGALLAAAGLQPTTFQESVQRYLERYAQENPAAIDAETVPSGAPPALIPSIAGAFPPRGTTTTAGRRLSIRPAPNATGMWVIVDATTGLAVPSGPDNMRQMIGLRDLFEFEQRRQTEERDREAARLAEAARKVQERREEEERRNPPPAVPTPIYEGDSYGAPLAAPGQPRDTATGGTIADPVPREPRELWSEPERLMDDTPPAIRMRQPPRRTPRLDLEDWFDEPRPELGNWVAPPRRRRRRRRTGEFLAAPGDPRDEE